MTTHIILNIKPINRFSAELDMQLYMPSSKLEIIQNNRSICYTDEMDIKESLVYDKHTGELIGLKVFPVTATHHQENQGLIPVTATHHQEN